MMGTPVVMGLDLGQARDFSALAVIRANGQDAKQRVVWAMPLLKRWQLGTSYVDVVAEVKRIAKDLDRPALVIDATGCGRPVFDLFREADLAVADLIGVTITSGHNESRTAWDNWTVPKRTLVGAVQSVLQTRRLKIAKDLQEAKTITRELAAFKVRITTSATETFENDWRVAPHDDLVLASAMALWWADQPQTDFNIRHLKLCGPTPAPEDRKKIMFPGIIRYFHQGDAYQPMPVLPGGEKVLSCPVFREQPQAAYFVVLFHRAFGIPEPDVTVELDPKDAKEIESKVSEFIQSRRLVPANP